MTPAARRKAAREIVTSVYATMLGRVPDPDADWFIAEIAAGRLDAGALVRAIAGSDEYRSRDCNHVHFSGTDTIRWLDIDFRVPLDQSLSAELHSEEGYEPWVLPYFMEQVGAASRILDVGASIGAFSLPAARKAVDGHVFAVEPSQQNARLMMESIALNGLKNVSVLPFGAGESAGHAFLPRQTLSNNNALTLPTTGLPPGSTHDLVPVMPLDSLRAHVGHIDIIKIDIEGYEYRAIQGARSLITECKPLIFFEYSPAFQKERSGVDGQLLLSLIAGLGYSFEILHRTAPREMVLPENRDRIDFIWADHVRIEHGTHLDICAHPLRTAGSDIRPRMASPGPARRDGRGTGRRSGTARLP